jgi:hypothetical protein
MIAAGLLAIVAGLAVFRYSEEWMFRLISWIGEGGIAALAAATKPY